MNHIIAKKMILIYLLKMKKNSFIVLLGGLKEKFLKGYTRSAFKGEL